MTLIVESSYSSTQTKAEEIMIGASFPDNLWASVDFQVMILESDNVCYHCNDDPSVWKD